MCVRSRKRRKEFDWASRKLDMFDRLFLAKDPIQPSRITVSHRPENNPGHFQSRLSQANCNHSCQKRAIPHEKTSWRCHTVRNSFGYSRGRHYDDYVGAQVRKSQHLDAEGWGFFKFYIYITQRLIPRVRSICRVMIASWKIVQISALSAHYYDGILPLFSTNPSSIVHII
jgi:hypothetical protein